jgi:dynein assembly factor 1
METSSLRKLQVAKESVTKPSDGLRHMSTEVVSEICKAKGGFRTPELNEQLYLHFGGFVKIECLDEFVNCRCLWLENNGITTIENLEPLVVLSALYLQHNSLRSLGTCSIPSLRSLNVCHNNLASLDGLQYLPNLEKLLASHNSLVDISALSGTLQLTVLDVSYNKLSAADGVHETLKQLTRLASLMLHGNDFVRDAKNYREELVVEHAGLRFLDEYPVFDDERRCCVAFMRGGETARRAEREKIRLEERERQQGQQAFFAKFIDDAKAKRVEEHGAALPPTEYYVAMARDADISSDGLATRQPAREIHSDDDDNEPVYVPAQDSTPQPAETRDKLSRHTDPFAALGTCQAEKWIEVREADPTPVWRKEVYQIPVRHHADNPPPGYCEPSEEEILRSFRDCLPSSLIDVIAKLNKSMPAGM